ncbi:MAG: hypothetical protein ABIN91_19570 [Mucilaginibacter sp.]|uniref:hypothetical protein n=1 Tax=Mucilaginibacter sp. TaxID=1882438 RepID=UPI003265E403
MKTNILYILFTLLTSAASAQMDMSHMGHDTIKKATADTAKKIKPRPGYHIMNGKEMKNSDMGMMDMDMGDMSMSHAYSRNLPMNRDGSGTGWLPDESPMYAYMWMPGKWNLMFHGALYPRYTSSNFNNDGKRGQGAKFDAPNWFMGMAQRKVGTKGLFAFNLMMSLDRLTEGGYGYPLLFQSGETWDGKALHDRQHPHDIFSELAVAYTQSFTKDIDLTGYIGYPGEPAIGPVAFMHRISAMNNPDATLGHHWQDATHITFGVATLGFRYKIAKIEASAFNGHEPDENRFDFDKPVFNSYSYRLSVAPDKHLALQFSQAQINGPEALNPAEDIFRTTASIGTQHNFNDDSYLSNTLVWGHNSVNHHDGHANASEHSITLESNLQLKMLALYGRYEFVQKSEEELSLIPATDELYNVNAFTLGINHRLFQQFKTDFTLGIQGTVNAIPNGLSTLYGNTPISGQVYLKISPSRMAP